MADKRRTIAWTLSKAAKRLPKAERQLFREFLRSLDGGEPPAKKVHSWKRKKPKSKAAPKKPRARRPKRDDQIPLPLD